MVYVAYPQMSVMLAQLLLSRPADPADLMAFSREEKNKTLFCLIWQHASKFVYHRKALCVIALCQLTTTLWLNSQHSKAKLSVSPPPPKALPFP